MPIPPTSPRFYLQVGQYCAILFDEQTTRLNSPSHLPITKPKLIIRPLHTKNTASSLSNCFPCTFSENSCAPLFFAV